MGHAWQGKVVVVTGATAGVGRATVRMFAREGARVGIIARDEARLAATEREIGMLGGRGLAVPADVADPAQVEAAAEHIERELGPIDVWINNAMTSVFAEFTDVTPAEYRRVTDVVYHGTVYGTMAALARMLPRNRGRIVLVGSALAYRGIPLQSAYCGAKHAIQGMFESLRSELLHRGTEVSIGTVHLPAVNTPQFEWCRNKLPQRPQPVPPIFQPEVAARAIVAMARSKRAEIDVAFSTKRAVVGNKLAPRVADWVLARRGYQAQQTSELELPARPDNLWTPVEGPFGAHGRFDDRSHERSPQTWMTLHPGVQLATAAVALLATALGSRAIVRWIARRHRG